MRYPSNYSPTAFPSFSRLFEEFFGSDFYDGSTQMRPSINIKEHAEGFELALAVPGFKKEDIKVEVEKNVLKVQSHTGDEQQEASTKYLRREFSARSFERSFTLPETVDVTKIVANYAQGVLTLALPKREAALEPGAKRIAIA
ncbi:MAG: Hsp20/alpha crystallin family protein [Bacteroidota bacterium]